MVTLSDEFRVGELLCIQHRNQCAPEQVRVLAVVEAEGDFVQVSRKVFGRKLEGADDAEFHEAPNALDGGRLNVGPHACDPFCYFRQGRDGWVPDEWFASH